MRPQLLKLRRRALAAVAEAEARLDADPIDYGIELRVVVQDPDGRVVEPGTPPVRVVDRHYLGGLIDPRQRRMLERAGNGSEANPDYLDRGGSHQIWYCGQTHARFILHGADLPDGVVICGGEGAGKTRGVLAMWLVARALDCVERGFVRAAPREAGCTAPTNGRRGHVLKALKQICRKDWFRWRAKDGEFVLRCGVTLELKSTHQRSEAEGSPIQGYNWMFCGRDEGQDSLDADADIEARGRTAPGGRYKQCITCTQKDWSRYRTWRDAKKRDSDWHVVTIPGPENPFVWSRRWERMRKLGKYEYARRVLAEDVRSPLATYPAWDRKIHIAPPDRFAEDVTSRILAGYSGFASRQGSTAHLLVGHDPGLLFNTSTFLKAYWAKRIVVWRIVGEFVTERTTQDGHAHALKHYLQQRFELQYDPDPRDPDSALRRVVVICDPHGNGEKRPSEDEYMSFRKHGFDVFSAEPRLKQIRKRTRVEMVNRLLHAADETVRLLMDADEYGDPVAPMLVTSIEDAKLDELGRADLVKKDETDTTHPSTALGYALWPFEREVITDYTRMLAGQGAEL